jgi:tRNA-uridine 2-sulfurtransferase
MNRKIIVAMSGGVDSSTVALLLKNKGYDVQGLFLDFFNSKKNIEEAEKVSKKIGIPIEILDISKYFKKKVINYFIDELKKGNTPNPCVVCNKEIKYKILFEKMLAFKADFVATGHYSRIIEHETHNMEHEFSLFEAKDKTKDQSYFLYKLSQKQLSKILFPLGDYNKIEVRKIAKKFGLHVHDKRESQDICFIPEKGYDTFLRKSIKKLKKGNICDSKGNILGIHEGLPFYTIGQRKGIKLGGNGPYYVIRKDFDKNRLIVGNKKELFASEMGLKEVNWIGTKPIFPFKALIRTRYRSPLAHAIIEPQNTKREAHNAIYKVKFDKPQSAITPGQSAVFYSEKGEVLGGGTIIR